MLHFDLHILTFQVPLVIFKREKEIARKLEFDGLWIAEQPDDDIKALWDKIVLSTSSFPDSYWDKFIKKKVRIPLLMNHTMYTVNVPKFQMIFFFYSQLKSWSSKMLFRIANREDHYQTASEEAV